MNKTRVCRIGGMTDTHDKVKLLEEKIVCPTFSTNPTKTGLGSSLDLLRETPANCATQRRMQQKKKKNTCQIFFSYALMETHKAAVCSLHLTVHVQVNLFLAVHL
jgi:hypothetical protein